MQLQEYILGYDATQYSGEYTDVVPNLHGSGSIL